MDEWLSGERRYGWLWLGMTLRLGMIRHQSLSLWLMCANGWADQYWDEWTEKETHPMHAISHKSLIVICAAIYASLPPLLTDWGPHQHRQCPLLHSLPSLSDLRWVSSLTSIVDSVVCIWMCSKWLFKQSESRTWNTVELCGGESSKAVEYCRVECICYFRSRATGKMTKRHRSRRRDERHN